MDMAGWQPGTRWVGWSSRMEPGAHVYSKGRGHCESPRGRQPEQVRPWCGKGQHQPFICCPTGAVGVKGTGGEGCKPGPAGTALGRQ